jgi:V/A-type H+-transporting ATPase subunit E
MERDKAMAQARLDGVELRDRMLRMAELDQRKELLAMKREVIDQAFNRAIARMQDMELPMARTYIEGLLLESAEGDEQIIISGQDEAIYDAAFLKSVNEKLALSGRLGKLSLSPERRDIRGGFVLTCGGVEINCAFDAVIGQRRALLELPTANALFQ